MCDPAVFLGTAGLFALPTPVGLFLPSQQPLRESPKLPALRADVFAKVRARHLGFLLPRRLRLIPPPKIARRRSSSALAVSATLPHGGATSGFSAPSGYALGCVRKTSQTADTGATAWEGPTVTGASSASAFNLLRQPFFAIKFRRHFCLLFVPAALPHVGATSGFRASGGYALGLAAKAAQTADTGTTVRNTLPVTSASPVRVHLDPAKSLCRTASATCAPAPCSRFPSLRTALLSPPHSGGR